MSEAVSVMLVGLGGYGGVYVRALLDDPALAPVPFQFVAGIDTNPQACVQYDDLQKMNLPIYADIKEGLEKHNPELCIISTPIHTHVPLASIALQHGCSVLLEKPLCGSLQEADELENIAKKSEGFLAIGYQNRYAKSTECLLADVQSGEFGKLIRQKCITLRPRNFAYYQRSAWAGRRCMPNGAAVFDGPAMNASAHFLYYQLLLAHAQTDAEAQLKECILSRANDIENHDSIALSYSCGDIDCLFLASHSVTGEEFIESEYEFEHAVLRSEKHQPAQVTFKDGRVLSYMSNGSGREKFDVCLAALRGGPQPPCDIASAKRHVALLEQIRDFPIRAITNGSLQRNNDQVWVDGLGEALMRAYELGEMPSDLLAIQ